VKSQPRFFVDAPCTPGAQVTLRSDDVRHARLVLRMRAGDPVVVVCDGSAWDARLSQVSAGRTTARIDALRSEQGGELPAFVTVLQAVPKGAKFDDVVEKTVELGARRIVPVRCERGYADAGDRKLERWRRIARAAAMQSRRRFVPEVESPIAWAQGVRLARSQPVLVAYERAPSGSLAAALAKSSDGKPFAIAIGPEGGLAPAEVDAARAAGCDFVSLGPTTLRTETAAAALLAACAACRGWW